MLRQDVKDLCFQISRTFSYPSTLLARARYRWTKPARPEGHYLHLGCGATYLDGFINVDGNVFRKVDLWHDLRNRLPFPDGSCRFVYTCHTLEHLFPHEAVALLGEIYRVLDDDGEARGAVPSMEHAMGVARGGTGVNEDWPRAFDDPVAQAINYLFCDGQHKYAYNFAVLADFARRAGFAGVENHSATRGVAPRAYGAVAVGDEPPGSRVVNLTRRTVFERRGAVAAK